jgi:translation initiation factor 2-alpha kinase 4
VKVARAAWHVGVLALHKSNPISLAGAACALADAQLPNAWLPREALTAPLDYTRSRDIHGAGVAFVQMLLGVDIPLRAPSPSEALAYCASIPSLH